MRWRSRCAPPSPSSSRWAEHRRRPSGGKASHPALFLEPSVRLWAFRFSPPSSGSWSRSCSPPARSGAGGAHGSAGATSAAFGIVVVVIGGFAFLALLVLFVVASVLATRYGFEEKKRKNVHEGVHGERGVSNVLAHILIPTGLVLVSAAVPEWLSTSTVTVLYTAALAFGAADTFASEFGVLAGRARSILTLRPVTRRHERRRLRPRRGVGVRGGLFDGGDRVRSLLGVPDPNPGIAVFIGLSGLAGFLGCQVDSVLGETLENRGYLTKGSTNFLGMASSVAFTFLAVVAVGGMW